MIEINWQSSPFFVGSIPMIHYDIPLKTYSTYHFLWYIFEMPREPLIHLSHLLIPVIQDDTGCIEASPGTHMHNCTEQQMTS